MRITKSMLIARVGKWLLLGLALVGLTAFAAAQSEAPPPPPPPHDMNMIFSTGGMGGMFHEGMGDGNVVKGVPMSGEIIVTRDQALADGNSIHTENQTMIYRDSEGRVRREIGFELVTPSTGAAKRTMIVITDPVSGNRYMLNPENKTARQMPLRHGPGPGDGIAIQEKVGTGPNTAQTIGKVWIGSSAANLKTEQLGTKTINGLQAVGTRMTRTIPAGQIGNLNPIEVVTESWYSSDLQLPVLMTHADPMMGTMTTKMINVTRGEPDASLFQVPSDYKLTSGKPGEPMYIPNP
ncbi:MAG: hypothetical protein WCC92_16470 [Candidatus Korobacteraceae bacterium]